MDSGVCGDAIKVSHREELIRVLVIIRADQSLREELGSKMIASRPMVLNLWVLRLISGRKELLDL